MSLLHYTKPRPPLDPVQTKRTEGEPAVEKARFGSLLREESLTSAAAPVRTPLEPRVINQNQNHSEVHTPNGADSAPGTKSENISSTDPKQLRKLRQQQLQQKFRREMEAKRLEQKQDQAKSEEAEVTIGRGSSGGKG